MSPVLLLRPNLNAPNKDNPFYNKRVVFTGDLDGMERGVAAQLIQTLGADINTPLISARTLLSSGVRQTVEDEED